MQTSQDELQLAHPKDLHNKGNSKIPVMLTQQTITKKKSKCPDCHRDYQKELICAVCGKCINCCRDRWWIQKFVPNKCPRNGEQCDKECHANHEGYCVIDEIDVPEHPEYACPECHSTVRGKHDIYCDVGKAEHEKKSKKSKEITK